ncbi:hypothetical protein [Shewanella sp. MBTL60-007]|uniref:hypothetical protein n=1 Tax=Shewanella sp. MBTL60-007 TaxID=2815911 RepID=UPI001BC0AC24|nr:hypothetical protein [Shewanella sp. MBTL60-007]GIU16193.1 hypothetical protein TUM3792_09660 [Shewanella sp. MBTL60-007]
MNKAILTIALAISLSGAAWANDAQPDPSDLTAVNSFAYGAVDNEGKLNGMLGLAGNYSEGNNFIGLVEHGVTTKNNQLGKKAQNSRLRYFQVLDTGSDILPQAGFSVDYMKDWKSTNADTSSDIVALGAIAKIPTPWQALSLYPNVAYVKGKAKQGTGNRVDLSGYQLNLFGSIALGDLGKYLVIQPQFMHLDGKPSKSGSNAKLSANIFKVKTGFGMPISDNGKWWTELSHTYTRSDAKAGQSGKFADGTLSEIDNDHKVELGVSYYF